MRARRLKFDIRKLFARTGGIAPRDSDHPGEADSDYLPRGAGAEGLETDYQTLISGLFRRWGIAQGCVTVEVKTVGKAGDGFDVFVALVRMVSWYQRSSMRLLVGLPLLEQKIRKTVRGTWLADYSHFGGLWLHASDKLQLPQDMRDSMLHMSQPAGSDSLPAKDSTPGGLAA